MNFYFYDLETSGKNPRSDRIMQFGGQRTNLDFKPIGPPESFLIKLSDDILPRPDAVMVHGITPQKTHSQGISEAEAVKYLTSQAFQPNSIIVGFNNIRFDDEFIRFLFWRNFTDPYEWQYKVNRSKWDLLDVVRMTRALRPKGINWPVSADGQPINNLEKLTAINNLNHLDAHDALGDVSASIALARLISSKQPKLFNYLLSMRNKNKVAVLVEKNQPFIYTSGRYDSRFEKTTVVVKVAKHPQRDIALVYDLRVDPDEFANLSVAELVEFWSQQGNKGIYFPVKKISYNRCPAVAPISVLEEESQKRLSLDQKLLSRNYKKLSKYPEFSSKLLEAVQTIEPKTQPEMVGDPLHVDSQLYDGFINNPGDKTKMSVVRAATGDEIAQLSIKFADPRLNALLPLYIARNYPAFLDMNQKRQWLEYKRRKLAGSHENQLLGYFTQLKDLSVNRSLTTTQKKLIKELEAYGQSVWPANQPVEK